MHGQLAIGGIEGRVYLFDASSKTKKGMNNEIHDSEILKIFFNDKLS